MSELTEQTDPAEATRLVYERPDGRWSWRLTDGNGRVLARGNSEGHPDELEAKRSVDRVLSGDFKEAARRRRPRRGQ
jgi:hypothetical protein